jgi:endonuclease/exonuclease/phosphatase (EEP) superfamily protein YafD
MMKGCASEKVHVNEPEPTVEPNPPGLVTRSRRSLRFVSVVLAAGFWLVGTILWFTVRDRFPLLAALSYGLPVPLLVVFGFWAVAFVQGERRKLRLVWLIVVLLQTGCWLSSSFVFRAEDVPEEAVTLLFWNVCRGYGDFEKVGAEINARDADVVALVEATNAGQNEELWRRVCPDYQVTRLGSGMVLLLRGEQLNWKFGAVPKECRYQILDLKIKSQLVTLIVIDVRSDPRFSREPAFDRIEELVTQYSDRPLIIAGDFNTPLESIYLARLRQRMQNAFEARGSGLRDTWPVLLPVLSLDQVWANDRVDWHRCEHGWSLSSDHRPVLATFSTRR